MSNPPADLLSAAEPRRRAEAPLKGAPAATIDAQRQLHELQVRQTELELRNENLRSALDASVEKYSGFYDFAPVCHFTFAADGAIRDANITACNYLGVERARLLGWRFASFLTAASCADFATFLQILTADDFQHACEVHLLGEPPHHARLDGMALHAAPGEEWCCRVVLIDDTNFKESDEQKRAMTEVHGRNAEEKEGILDALSAQIALLDPFGRIVAVNESWRAFASANALECTNFFMGRNYLEVCDRATGDCSEDAAAMAQGLRAVLSGQQSRFTFEYPCHLPQEQRWYRLDATPVSTARQAGAVVMHVDITERKMSDQRLREEQAQLAGLINAAMDAIVTVDATQTIVRVNPAAEAIFGWSASQMIGQPLTRLIPARFGAQHVEEVRAFGVSGASSRRMGALGAIWGARADGQEFPIEASISQIEVGGDKFYTAILRDVTRRRRAEAELQRTSDEMRALARHLEVVRDEQAAHIARELHDELGQTLTVLKLLVNAMQKRLEAPADAPPSSEAREAYELIEDSVASLRRLCTELRPPMLDHLGLGTALGALAANFQTRFGIHCILEAPADFPLLDPPRQITFYQLVRELLTNVARHSGASAVRIVLRELENALELEVSDNGCGISDTKRTATKSFGMLGMRERALAAGGTITFEGHPGQGTTVRARLPLTLLPDPP